MKLKHLPILCTIYLLFLIAFFSIICLSKVIMTIAILVICGAIFLIASSITVKLSINSSSFAAGIADTVIYKRRYSELRRTLL